jgi:hypothetical protein
MFLPNMLSAALCDACMNDMNVYSCVLQTDKVCGRAVPAHHHQECLTEPELGKKAGDPDNIVEILSHKVPPLLYIHALACADVGL